MRQRHRTGKLSAKAAADKATAVSQPRQQLKKRRGPPAPPPPPVYAGPSITHEARELLPRKSKLAELERQLRMTKTSTASLGKYDNRLAGEATREKGKRRQFESNEIKDSSAERERALAVLAGMENEVKVEAKKRRIEKDNGEGDVDGEDRGVGDVLNTRKAIRSQSKGRGSASLAGEEKKNKVQARLARLGNAKSGRGGGGGKSKSSLSKGKRGK